MGLFSIKGKVFHSLLDGRFGVTGRLCHMFSFVVLYILLELCKHCELRAVVKHGRLPPWVRSGRWGRPRHLSVGTPTGLPAAGHTPGPCSLAARPRPGPTDPDTLLGTTGERLLKGTGRKLPERSPGGCGKLAESSRSVNDS